MNYISINLFLFKKYAATATFLFSSISMSQGKDEGTQIRMSFAQMLWYLLIHHLLFHSFWDHYCLSMQDSWLHFLVTTGNLTWTKLNQKRNFIDQTKVRMDLEITSSSTSCIRWQPLTLPFSSNSPWLSLSRLLSLSLTFFSEFLECFWLALSSQTGCPQKARTMAPVSSSLPSLSFTAKEKRMLFP